MSEILRGDTKVADVTNGKYAPGTEDREGFRLRCRDTVHEKWKITSDIEATSQILKPKCMYLVSTLLAIILCLNIEIIQAYLWIPYPSTLVSHVSLLCYEHNKISKTKPLKTQTESAIVYSLQCMLCQPECSWLITSMK